MIRVLHTTCFQRVSLIKFGYCIIYTMTKDSTTVSAPKECDICDREADYDGKTKMGAWAYMCQKHFEKLGVGLGTGRGQKLEVE